MSNTLQNEILAREVLFSFSDLDRLTVEECRKLKIYKPSQQNALIQALGPGDQAIITPHERGSLRSVGFDDNFITVLAGADGEYARDFRSSWLRKKLFGQSGTWDIAYAKELYLFKRHGRVVARAALRALLSSNPDAQEYGEKILKDLIPVSSLISFIEIPDLDTKRGLFEIAKREMQPGHRHKLGSKVTIYSNFEGEEKWRTRIVELIFERGITDKDEQIRMAKILVRSMQDRDYYFPGAAKNLAKLDPNYVMQELLPHIEKPPPGEICVTQDTVSFCIEHRFDRVEALKVLAEFGPKALFAEPILRRMVSNRHNEEEVRVQVVETLGAILEDKEFAPFARQIFLDEDNMPFMVRRQALKSLTNRPPTLWAIREEMDQEILPWFQDILSDPDTLLKKGRYRFLPLSLPLLGKSAKPLVESLEDILDDDEAYPKARLKVARTLAVVDPDTLKKYIPALVRLLQQVSAIEKSIEDVVVIMRALGPYGLELMMQLATVNQPQLQKVARLSLAGFIPDRDELEDYGRVLTMPVAAIREKAVTNVYRSLIDNWEELLPNEREQAVNALIIRLDDSDQAVSQEAAQVLEELVPLAKAYLLNSARSKNENIRYRVVQVLRNRLDPADPALIMIAKQLARDDYSNNRQLALSILVDGLADVNATNVIYFQQIFHEGGFQIKLKALDKIATSAGFKPGFADDVVQPLTLSAPVGLIDELVPALVEAYYRSGQSIQKRIGILLTSWALNHRSDVLAHAVPVLLQEFAHGRLYAYHALNRLPFLFPEDVVKITALQHPTTEVLSRSLGYLEKLGPEAIEALDWVQELRDQPPEPVIGDLAARTYRAITRVPKTPPTRKEVPRSVSPKMARRELPYLIQDLKAGQTLVTLDAIGELAQREEVARLREVIAPLAQLVVSPSTPVQLEAILALKKIGSEHLDLTLSALIKGATSPSIEVRYQSIDAISHFGRRAVSLVEVLVKALDDSDEDVRSSALRALADVAPDQPQTLRLLQGALQSPNESQAYRVAALHGLAELETKALPAVPIILTVMQNTKGQLRAQAAYALGMILTPTQVTQQHRQAFLDIVKQQGQELNWVALYAMSRLEIVFPEMAATLMGLLDSSDNQKARYAAASLGNMKELPDKALEQLLTISRDPKRDWQVRVEAIIALGRLRFVKAMPDLLDLTTNPRREIVYAARQASQRMGVRGLAGIKQALNNPKAPVKVLALQLMQEFGEGRLDLLGDYESQVRALAQDSSAKVRAEALYTLAYLNPDSEDLLELLVKGLKDSNPRVVQSALNGLGELRYRASSAVGDIVAFLDHEVSALDQAAFNALVKMSHTSIVVEALGDHLIAREHSASKRIRVAQIFRKMGPNDTISAYLQMLRALDDKSDGVVLQIIRAFAKYRYSKWREDPVVHGIITENIIPRLGHLVRDPKRQVKIRLRAIDALGQLGFDDAVPILTGATENPNPQIRQAAQKALSKIN